MSSSTKTFERYGLTLVTFLISFLCLNVAQSMTSISPTFLGLRPPCADVTFTIGLADSLPSPMYKKHPNTFKYRPCPTCQIPVLCRLHGRPQFCCPFCEYMSFVDIRGHDECWGWRGYTGGYGYGHLNRKWGSHQTAHRSSWLFFMGAIPEGLWVLHDCPNGDNPTCSNPNHLWLGTPEDNMKDCVEKGRQKPSFCTGEEHGMSKLKEHEVRIILSSKGKEKATKLASTFSVSIYTVYLIWKREIWKNVNVI